MQVVQSIAPLVNLNIYLFEYIRKKANRSLSDIYEQYAHKTYVNIKSRIESTSLTFIVHFIQSTPNYKIPQMWLFNTYSIISFLAFKNIF